MAPLGSSSTRWTSLVPLSKSKVTNAFFAPCISLGSVSDRRITAWSVVSGRNASVMENGRPRSTRDSEQFLLLPSVWLSRVHSSPALALVPSRRAKAAKIRLRILDRPAPAVERNDVDGVAGLGFRRMRLAHD